MDYSDCKHILLCFSFTVVIALAHKIPSARRTHTPKFGCNRHAINKCQNTSGLNNHLKVLITDIPVHYDVMIESQWLFNLTTNQSRAFCNDWGHYDACLNNDVIPDCSDLDAAVFKGISDATFLFCREETQRSKALRTCVADFPVFGAVKHCSHDYINDTTGELIDRKHACDLTDEKVKQCFEKALHPNCGQQLSLWLENFIRVANKPIADMYQCTAWPKWISITINVVIGLGMFIIVMGCTLYCYRVVRRKKRGDSPQRQNNNSGIFTPYNHLRSGSAVGRDITVVDAAQVDEGTELCHISDRKTLISNEIC